MQQLAVLVIESYQYAYNEAGQPVIELTVLNPDTEVLRGDIGINVSRALQTAQNEYVYKRAASTKALRNATFPPGEARHLRIGAAPLLKPGTYEAEVRLRDPEGAKAERFDFEVTPAAFEQARAERGDGGGPAVRQSPVMAAVRMGAWMLLAGIVVLAGTKTWRKTGWNKKGRKARRRSNPEER
ncbi:hypothetical protein SAMN02799624_04223 [Paenibacillus sp. UNC496MF]|uniref:hypothetical protein n=1 Tax=Paenibacillus sp. UNC496MF TaxID=1502753 RepID=UPI0008E14BDD|nr:hypothetical protein [Paenibacillus sp. UNC496MF]SFJ35451.1 hypothetical protein SAMN02799624_04223 [Paenibacillus sp. UNC496MF]